jgi:hypothetical protein
MNFIQRNVFKKLRSEYFQSDEALEPMTYFKRQKLEALLNNVTESKEGNIALTTPFLKKKLKNIEQTEHHAIDTNIETIELLHLIVSNINATLNYGVSLKGIIQLGEYLRSPKGGKVDWLKLDKWLSKLHLVRMSQLEGSILILFFHFDEEEVPFVHHVEKGANGLTIRSLCNTWEDLTKEWHFRQGSTGFVHNNNKVLWRNLRQSMRYFIYAPIETLFNFLHNFARSLSEIEE